MNIPSAKKYLALIWLNGNCALLAARPASLGNLPPRGHSIEARIYAEDVHQNFFPAPGPVSSFITPNSPGIRWETGLDTVDEVTTRFDPMVAKLVATGESREAALARLTQTLKSMFLANSSNNISLLTWLAGFSEFRNKVVSTHFIADAMPEFFNWEKSERSKLEAAATAALDAVAFSTGHNLHRPGARDLDGASESLTTQLTRAAFGSRLKIAPAPSDQMTPAHLHHEKILAQDGTTTTRMGLGSVRLAGQQVPFHFASRQTGGDRVLFINLRGHNFSREIARISLDAPISRSSAAQATSLQVSAPVPGKIVAIKVSAGVEIEEGAAVLVIESMKMEFEVKSQRQGRIESVDVTVGEQVSAGQTVARWSP
ncbi:MAG: hypothetical protein EBU49_06470 [Proteobacteria bacterium]|nr:hypothetical protein [Pseudomonadota bacterium]